METSKNSPLITGISVVAAADVAEVIDEAVVDISPKYSLHSMRK